MPVLIGSEPISQLPETVEEIYKSFPFLEAEALKLVQSPLRVIDKPEGVLYITQKEYAVLHSSDENFSIVGTDDATTCHIVVLVNREESSVCVAHIDSTDDLEDELARMVFDVLGQQNMKNDFPLELSIMGGYCDEMRKSEVLTLDLLHFYNQLPVKFQLKSLCVGSVNTRSSNGINWPIMYGAAVNIHSDFVISPAKVYHSTEGVFKISPFNYRFQSQMAEWALKSDDFILNNFSTSPAVEPEHFSKEMKEVFQFIIHNPFPMISIFKFNKSLKYVPSPQGQWLKL
ncbi:hypothetical protein DAPPUDRAFT_305857 [Daphnia pulex]|uniref:Protein N-terminal asparagine amidohydrolase n=1 Tax=Daphnia pulex TaxID=6669 RepID=E9GT71_DAPPU|nr:hypothetical protein DAPPUDRAFT_305857 [Daphnia pulex]|eukprot:EFX77324.1 hypothetical protein DAPPUDRAFT_305857 [Daphnia pulex]